MAYVNWLERRRSWMGLWRMIRPLRSKTALSAYQSTVDERTTSSDDLSILCLTLRPELYEHVTEQTREQIRLVVASWVPGISVEAKKLLIALFEPRWHSNISNNFEALVNYLEFGVTKDLSPGPMFNGDIYRLRVAKTKLPLLLPEDSSILHWLRYGAVARIVPTDRFVDDLYYKSYPDIAGSGLWAFAHFIQFGAKEGRSLANYKGFYRTRNANIFAQADMPSAYRVWLRQDRPDLISEVEDFSAAYEYRLHKALKSGELNRILAETQEIEPHVCDIDSIQLYLLPPLHQGDGLPFAHAEVQRRLPRDHYDSVVCVPCIRTGSADLVACILASALLRIRSMESVLILGVDSPQFDNVNWVPPAADYVDISDLTSALEPDVAMHFLRLIFRGVTARRVFNVNSQLCWQTMRSYGKYLSKSLNTYAYMFCWDQTEDGRSMGYPSEYFAETAATMTAFLTDTFYLRDELARVYRLPLQVLERIVPIFTPAQSMVQIPSAVRSSMDSEDLGCQQTVLWAGRLDRQIRFDFVQEIARLMPDVSFWCWCEELQDYSSDLTRIPDNIKMKGHFKCFIDLPFAEAGVWLFTSAWQGMPTTIIELAIRGLPVVSSSVDAVSEFIQVDSGWPIKPDAEATAYVEALRHALGNPQEATRRAERLQSRVTGTYTDQKYDESLSKLISGESLP